MSLGSVLIKPQPVATPLPPEVDVSEVVAAFFESFTRNPEGAAAAAEILARIAPETLANLMHGMEERVRLSDGKIRALFRPFGAGIDAFVAGLEKDQFVDVLKGALELVAAVLQQLTKARVQAFVREFADIVTRDLGISQQTLRDVVTTLATQLITELKRDVIAGQVTRTSIARYEFGAALDGLKSLFDEEEIELPTLDVQVLIDAIGLLWDQGRIDRIIAWLLELLAHADDVLQPLAVAIEARLTLKLEVSVTPAPLSAAAVQGATIAGAPAAAAAPSGHPPIAWYASWVAAKTLRYPTDDSAFPSRFRNPELIGFTYKHLSKETMERMAFHTAWVVPAMEALLLHVPSMEQGDVLSNLHITVLDVLDFGLILGDKSPVPNWWHWTAKPLMTMFLWGFESGWSRVGAANDPYVWTNAAGDLGEVLLYWRWSRLTRELLLSFFTLLNHDPAANIIRDATTNEPVVRNVERYEGVCYAFWEFGALLVPLITRYTGRKDYGFIGGRPSPQFFSLMFGGFAVAAAFGYASILVARVVAGEFFDNGGRYAGLCIRSRLFGPYEFKADFSNFSGGADSVGGWFGTPLAVFFMVASSFGDAPVYAYLLSDGATDDGTYGVDLFGIEREWQGYPAADTSPYRLPWAGMEQCVQGNLGVWSHYPQNGSQAAPFNNSQLYAYDYGHNVGTEVLCSRAGIVSAAMDIYPDNNTSNWNYCEVMHLVLNPATGGLAAVAPPALITLFADGVTAIPAGTLFPPYWDGFGNPLPGMPNPVPLHPSAAILPGATPAAPGTLAGAPTYYAGYNGFNAGTTFAFTDAAVDRLLAGATIAAFSDGTPAPANTVFAPNVPNPPPPGTPTFPVGTSFFPTNGMVIFLPVLNFADGTPIPVNASSLLASVAFAANTPSPPPAGTPTIPFGNTPAGGVTVFVRGSTFTDGTPIPAGAIFPLDVRVRPVGGGVVQPFAGSPFYPAGTNLPEGVFAPIQSTFCVYGHLLNGYMQVSTAPTSPTVTGLTQTTRPTGLVDIYRSRRQTLTLGNMPAGVPSTFTTTAIPATVTGDILANGNTFLQAITASDVLGLFVPQGRPIALSGDTGVSAYNHLHTMVYSMSAPIQAIGGGNPLPWRYAIGVGYALGSPTLPFAYTDVAHGIVHGLREGLRSRGVPRSFTFYDSGNTRIVPT